jgi:hypothetical protein
MRRYWRPASGPIQEIMFAIRPFVATDLSNTWESYNVQIQVINWLFRSGDRIQVHESPVGERLLVPFKISPNVVIPAGSYTWRRHRLVLTTAEKRHFSTAVSWVFGGFYDGQLEDSEFTQTLVATRLSINVSSDLSVASYAQYDTVNDSIGINTQLRWTFLPVADLFVVYNHNLRSLVDRWQAESNQLLIKLQYAWRM